LFSRQCPIQIEIQTVSCSRIRICIFGSTATPLATLSGSSDLCNAFCAKPKRFSPSLPGLASRIFPNGEFERHYRGLSRYSNDTGNVYFEVDDERRPFSIIITTLAARAYTGHTDIADALIAIINEMPRYIDNRNGKWWVENPAHPEENFADKWNEKADRRVAFLTWLGKARTDFAVRASQRA